MKLVVKRTISDRETSRRKGKRDWLIPLADLEGKGKRLFDLISG
jgi:hypothetical protein